MVLNSLGVDSGWLDIYMMVHEKHTEGKRIRRVQPYQAKTRPPHPLSLAPSSQTGLGKIAGQQHCKAPAW